MKYAVLNDNYCTFTVFERNKMATRAYFVPFSTADKAATADYKTAYKNSDLVSCLSGEWDFKYYANPNEVPAEFDTDKIAFDKVEVPSCWQFTGYDKPFYLNVRYPFKCQPPVIPTTEPIKSEDLKIGERNNVPDVKESVYNSVGIYRTTFSIKALDKRYTLAFLGVASSLDLFINGKFVGYSEGSHNTAEFEINDYITTGENELVAAVRRWSTGSYLECQDMFRNCGIFRDVLLYATPESCINDFDVKTPFVGESYSLKVTVSIVKPEGEVSAEFMGKKITLPAAESVLFDFGRVDVEEWSAEIPKLYDLMLSVNGQYILQRVGFKHIEIKDKVFYFNGKKIKIKGVNHHDTDPKKGYVMTADDIIRDIELMKEYNVNAVRTSHYPPSPLLIQAAAEYGLYVIDEADIETHGAGAVGNINLISNDLKWKEHYLDRVKRLYLRDRNNVCITMWSLGNEAGGIRCQDACYEYLKTVTDIPVHYEAACRSRRQGYDVVSEMYTSIENMEKRRKILARFWKARKHPYFLCEYCHAMGVGAGALREYWDLFYSNDIYMGGCIWEWADHAVYHADGLYHYTYGGDHGEYIHDGNFCVDGLFFPDRRPHTGALQMKVIYSPLRAKYEGGKLTLTNTNRFLSSFYLKITADVISDGRVVKTYEVNEVLLPEETKTLSLENADAFKHTDLFISFTYTDKASGRIVAVEQVGINAKLPEVKETAVAREAVEDGKLLIVKSGKAVITFDESCGELIGYTVDGKEVFNTLPVNRHGARGFYPELYRAPTDNDRNLRWSWDKFGYDKYKISKKEVNINKSTAKTVISSTYTLSATKKVADVTETYTVFGDGVIRVDVSLKADKGAPALPRVGLAVELNSCYDMVTYCGRGRAESYPDFNAHAPIGTYSDTANFNVPYIKPQNSGARGDCRYARIVDAEGDGVKFVAKGSAFSLNVNHFTEDALSKWEHTEDVENADTVCVNIDGFMSGIGSNSCGPRPEKQYILPSKNTYAFSFYILPAFKG